jgi:hypothetical protein
MDNVSSKMLGVKRVLTPTLVSGLKKYVVFSLFRNENCGFFCIFYTFFFPPRKDTLKF